MANCQSKLKFNGGEYNCYLIALRDIQEGEELLFDYNYTLDLDWLKYYKQKYIVK